MREPITSLEPLLDDPVARGLVGSDVALDRVPVQSVVGDHLFWVGTSRDRRVPVLLLGERTGRQPESQVEVAAGQALMIFGIVRATSPEALFEGAALLSEQQRRELLASDIYISALRVLQR